MHFITEFTPFMSLTLCLNWLTNAFPLVRPVKTPQLNETLLLFLVCMMRWKCPMVSSSLVSQDVSLDLFCLLPSVLSLSNLYILTIFRWSVNSGGGLWPVVWRYPWRRCFLNNISITAATMENWTQFSLCLYDNPRQEFYRKILLLS